MIDTQKYKAIEKIILQAEDEIEEISQFGKDIKILKNDKYKKVASFYFPPTQERLLLKLIYPKGNTIKKFIKRFRISGCQKEFENTLHYFRAGFKVPKPISWGEKKSWGWLKNSYLLCQEIEHAVSLGNYFQQWGDNCNLWEKRNIIRQLGEYIGRLHKQFIYHGDLRSMHILIKKEADGIRLYLIDCEASRIYNGKNEKIMLWDLRKLRKSTMGFFRQGLITQTDRLRFFKAYCKYNPHVAQNFSYYASRILELKNEWGASHGLD